MSRTLNWTSSVVAIAVIVVLSFAAAGCESDNNDSDHKDKERARQDRLEQQDRQSDRERDPDAVISRDSRRPRRGMDEIPTSAKRVDEGDSARLTYSPSRAGTLYVYDADDDRLIYSGGVRADDRFAMDPADDRATVNGRTVLGSDLKPNHRYRLYFEPRQ